jgi:hypothetical protein
VRAKKDESKYADAEKDLSDRMEEGGKGVRLLCGTIIQ